MKQISHAGGKKPPFCWACTSSFRLSLLPMFNPASVLQLLLDVRHRSRRQASATGPPYVICIYLAPRSKYHFRDAGSLGFMNPSQLSMYSSHLRETDFGHMLIYELSHVITSLQRLVSPHAVMLSILGDESKNELAPEPYEGSWIPVRQAMIAKHAQNTMTRVDFESDEGARS
jgi:hypothetical protein